MYAWVKQCVKGRRGPPHSRRRAQHRKASFTVSSGSSAVRRAASTVYLDANAAPRTQVGSRNCQHTSKPERHGRTPRWPHAQQWRRAYSRCFEQREGCLGSPAGRCGRAVVSVQKRLGGSTCCSPPEVCFDSKSQRSSGLCSPRTGALAPPTPPSAAPHTSGTRRSRRCYA